MHEVLRTETIEHMKANADFYRQYMAVNSVRRNPKRKTATAPASHVDTAYYTEEQLQKQFEDHVEKMGQPGEWADNMEVSALPRPSTSTSACGRPTSPTSSLHVKITRPMTVLPRTIDKLSTLPTT